MGYSDAVERAAGERSVILFRGQAIIDFSTLGSKGRPQISKPHVPLQ
jgi:hypothetical protein